METPDRTDVVTVDQPHFEPGDIVRRIRGDSPSFLNGSIVELSHRNLRRDGERRFYEINYELICRRVPKKEFHDAPRQYPLKGQADAWAAGYNQAIEDILGIED